jgi:hypothetical protein
LNKPLWPKEVKYLAVECFEMKNLPMIKICIHQTIIIEKVYYFHQKPALGVGRLGLLPRAPS